MPLLRAAGHWVKELPSVLWSLRTTPNASTQFTPFFMVYGAEAVLPSEVRYEAPQVVAYTEARSNTAVEDSMDLLDEARDIVAARSAVYQQGLRNYHSRRVRHRAFTKGDLVLRLKQESHTKLESPWEGPYVIHEVILGEAAAGEVESPSPSRASGASISMAFLVLPSLFLWLVDDDSASPPSRDSSSASRS